MTATRTPASNDAEKVQARISSSHRAWEVTTFLVITGGMLAVGGWYCLAYSDTPKLALLPKQINAVVVTSVIYTNLAAIGIFGLIGLYSRDSTALGLYAVLLWNHFVLSLLSGGFLLWAMLYGDPASSNGLLNQCSVLASSNMVTQVLCEYNFQRLRNIATGTTVAMWIIQFGACITCSHFVSLAARDDDVIYEGPEFGTVWVPQASQGGYDVVEVLEEADDEEYKTPRTAEFSRFSWV